MHLQLDLLLEQHRLPLTKDAHLLVDKDLEKVAGVTLGYAVDGQLLSTISRRSILFPLQYEAIFATNPNCTLMHGTCEQLIHPFRMTSSLSAPPGHHGHMPTLIAQPWMVDPQAELQLVTRFFGLTSLHRHCLDDIYATCLLRIQHSFTVHGHSGINMMVQLLWHHPAVAPPPASSKKGVNVAKTIGRHIHRRSMSTLWPHRYSQSASYDCYGCATCNGPWT